MVNSLPAIAGDVRDMSLILGSGRFSGAGGNNTPTPVFLPGKFHEQKSLVGYI